MRRFAAGVLFLLSIAGAAGAQGVAETDAASGASAAP